MDGREEEELREVRGGERRGGQVDLVQQNREGGPDIQMASDIFLVFWRGRNIGVRPYCKLAL